jgi:hypothetical protein
MSLFDHVASLSLEIDSYSLEGLALEVGTFTRRTTLVRLAGGGHEGIGEDVTYDEADQLALQREGPTLPLASSRHTLESFSELLERLALFPNGPAREQFREYRRWAYESAALDLALRQAGTSLDLLLEREAKPVRFVASMRLGDPASLDPVRRWLEVSPGLRFKLDPTYSWTDAVVSELSDAGVVDILDLKGAYHGTPVDQAPDPTLYARVATAFPTAWIEDPALTEETDPVLQPHRNRITWDAPIHSVGDIRALPFPPRTLNFKPSRFGTVRALFDAYDFCAENEIGLYGGGQFELGPGRGQIQYLASLFHPDGPNDVAPREYNEGSPRPGLAPSPLEPALDTTGFRWG